MPKIAKKDVVEIIHDENMDGHVILVNKKEVFRDQCFDVYALEEVLGALKVTVKTSTIPYSDEG